MPMVSYAQTWEDVLLCRAFPPGTNGFYVDVGANDPVNDSVTKHFYDRGWHGINVEPQRKCFELLSGARQRDVNLFMGISNREGTLSFFEVPGRDGWSTFSPVLAESFRQQKLEVVEQKIPVKTLAQVCEKHAHVPIDFMKIDVEGHEAEVIEGGDWKRGGRASS